MLKLEGPVPMVTSNPHISSPVSAIDERKRLFQDVVDANSYRSERCLSDKVLKGLVRSLSSSLILMSVGETHCKPLQLSLITFPFGGECKSQSFYTHF